jgi:hypothetical protein
MTDLELTEICAKWCGLEHKVYSNNVLILKEMGFGTLNEWIWIRFRPLHNWNDLMDIVVPKFSDDKYSMFSFRFLPPFCFMRKYLKEYRVVNLTDFPGAILELIAEIVEGKHETN